MIAIVYLAGDGRGATLRFTPHTTEYLGCSDSFWMVPGCEPRD